MGNIITVHRALIIPGLKKNLSVHGLHLSIEGPQISLSRMITAVGLGSLRHRIASKLSGGEI